MASSKPMDWHVKHLAGERKISEMTRLILNKNDDEEEGEKIEGSALS